MKNLLSLFALFVAALSFAQPTCQLAHHTFDDFNPVQFRSGNESLRSDTIDVINYSVYLDFTQGGSNLMAGNCEVKFETLMDVSTISLDLLQLNIDSIVFQGAQVPYSYNDTLIVADLGGTLTSGTTDSITVYYEGTPQIDPSGWGGFYMALQFFYNLGVGFDSDPHNYGRTWHPCFDNFVERATYDFEILSADAKTAYCNGTRTGVQTVGTDSLLTTWVMSEEIPSYLASVAVGDYVHVEQNYASTLQSINIPIWLAALEGDTSNLKASFANLNGAMEAYETFYGPYVWERVGYVLVPFSSGAMEHATNIAYPQITANGTLQFETLMAHELSHHWWGDWVTCETAEEMWINEGMAVYSEHSFLEHIYGYDTYLDEVLANHYHVLHKAHIEDQGHYALNAVPTEFTYGEHSYHKGADVMHSLRGYVGDANFFAGLQAVQTTFGGGTCSSEQFRDEFNTIAGVDVTNFFNDWIFQSGFSQFSIANMTSTQNGTNYDVELLIDQKLKGATNYHTAVPMQVTFMDAGWNSYATNLVLGGDYEVQTVSVPFEPVFAALNMDNKISQAVTSDDNVIKTTGIKLMNMANVRLNTTAITDSAYLRVEHNWVYADFPINLPNMIVSPDRYWNITGIDLENISGKLKFDYNAQNTASGDMDNSLLLATGGQGFNEDSLVLLWRPNATVDWQIHPDYTHNTSGNPVDKFGFMETNTFMGGQYCFGYRVHSIGLLENNDDSVPYTLYPNPADDTILIDLSDWEEEKFVLELYSLNGALIQRNNLNGANLNTIDVSHLKPGAYSVIITDGGIKRYSAKRVVIQ